MWTTSDILTVLQDVNYACLFLEWSDGTVKCGPGQEKWQHDLNKLTGEQRIALEARIERWKELMKGQEA